MGTVIATDWWKTYDNIVGLVEWMAASGRFTKDDIAYAVGKPWKFGHEYEQAQHESNDHPDAEWHEDCPVCSAFTRGEE